MSVTVTKPLFVVLLLTVSIGLAPGVAWTLEPIRSFPEDAGSYHLLRYSPDGKRLAGLMSGTSFEVRMWDVGTAKMLPSVGHMHSLGGFWFAAKGKELIVTDVAPDVKIWDIEKQEARLTIPLLEPRVGGALVTPDEQTLIVGSRAHAATLFDLKTGKMLAILKHSAGAVSNFTLSPDGKTLATGHRCNSIILWDVAARKQLHVCAPPERTAFQTFAFSPDSQTLACCHDGDRTFQVILWDVKAGKRKSVGEFSRQEFDKVKNMAFTPEGKRLLLVGFGYIPMMMWDIEKKEPIPDFTLRVKVPEYIQGLAISPDGKTFATGGRPDKRIKIWNLPPYKP